MALEIMKELGKTKNESQAKQANLVEIIPPIIAIKKIAVSTLHTTFVVCLLIKTTTFQIFAFQLIRLRFSSIHSLAGLAKMICFFPRPPFGLMTQP